MKTTWKINKLENVCEIIVDKPVKFSGTKKYYTTKGINNEGNYRYELVDYLTRPGRADLMPEVGDVGFAKMKNTNKVFIINENLHGCIFSTGFSFLRAKKNVLPRYLFIFIASDEFQKIKDDLSGDGIMGGIKKSDIGNIKIPVPPIFEQKRIVKILDEVFEKTAKTKESAKKNLQNASELFESYLQSIFANPSEKWEEKVLGEISSSFGRGKSKHRPRNDKKLYGGKYPFIQTGNIKKSNHYITEYSQTYNETGLAQSKLWPKGTICITIAANIAETGILDFDACFPDSVIGIVVNPKLTNIDFVEYLLQSFKSRIQAKGKGSAQDNINLGTFENELFPFPPLKEQRLIIAKLNLLSAETKKLGAIYQQKLIDLVELEKSILQKAFNGKLARTQL